MPNLFLHHDPDLRQYRLLVVGDRILDLLFMRQSCLHKELHKRVHTVCITPMAAVLLAIVVVGLAIPVVSIAISVWFLAISVVLLVV